MGAESGDSTSTTSRSFVAFAQIYTKEPMNILRSQEEFSVTILAATTNDELLVERA
jgi:hypothetical protein